MYVRTMYAINMFEYNYIIMCIHMYMYLILLGTVMGASSFGLQIHV